VAKITAVNSTKQKEISHESSGKRFQYMPNKKAK